MGSAFRLSRRGFLATMAAAAVVGIVGRARAQPRPIRVGALHPVTGPLAEVGLACRLGAQLAVDAVNAGGGIQSHDGARLELLVGDSVAGAASEAERLFNSGACAVVGAFHSGHTRAAASVARRRNLPFLIDTAIADGAMLPVVSGERPVVFRNFPTTTSFARRALQYLGEIFGDAQRRLARVTLLHTTDTLGTTQARRLEAAYATLRPSFELLEFVPISPRATTVAAEVAKLRAAAPDVVLLAVRAPIVTPLFTQLARTPLASAALVSLGTPDLAEAARTAGVGPPAIEGVMEMVAWPNLRNARTQRLADDFKKRSGGRALDAVSGYAHEAVLVLADALRRTASTEAAPLAEALGRTSIDEPLMVTAGPIVFDATGENPNAAPALVQIFGGKPIVVWPQSAAARPYALGVSKP